MVRDVVEGMTFACKEVQFRLNSPEQIVWAVVVLSITEVKFLWGWEKIHIFGKLIE